MEYMTKMIKICLWTLALTPFIVDKFAFFPYSTGENLFARGLLVLVSIFFIIHYFINKIFRDKIIQKIKIAIKNPIVISILAFVLIFIISTIFAIDKYNAFWGTIERGEGLIGLTFFITFFVFSLLLFEKKDWTTFFKLGLLVSFILLIKEFLQFFSGIARPGSFLDNPVFLAGYLIFSIFCSIAVFSEVKNNYWKYFSILILILSIFGIFITGSRGTLVGVAAGFIFVTIYCISKGKKISYGKFNLRKSAIIVLGIIFIFSSVFISTRKSEIWQKIPGLSRFSSSAVGDFSSIQTRLLTYKLSLEAANPIQNGMKKFIIGWGPENFGLAYGQYFNPEQFKYEIGWFDRSHNKLLDILIMNGLLGLTAYLFIIFYYFKSILKKKDISLVNIGLIFFGTSLFIHLLFVFDQITTSIPFFALLSFIVYLSLYNNQSKEIKKQKEDFRADDSEKVYIGTFFSVLALFLIFVFISNDLIASIQMGKYISLMENGDSKIMLDNIDSVFEPFNQAQMNIRVNFLQDIEKKYDKNDVSIVKLSDIAFLKAEEYIQKNPFDTRFLFSLSSAYSNKGRDLKSEEFLNKGEYFFKKLLIYTPNKPDVIYGLAVSLFYQKKYDESFSNFERAFDLSANYFTQHGKEIEGAYIFFFKHFFQTRDKENLIKAVKRLKQNNYADSANLDLIIKYIEKGTWPNINFTS